MLALALLAVLATSFASDEITSLPLWDGDLPSKQYSGYLNITATKHIQYWLVKE